VPHLAAWHRSVGEPLPEILDEHHSAARHKRHDVGSGQAPLYVQLCLERTPPAVKGRDGES
jgi:hypothetical protein